VPIALPERAEMLVELAHALAPPQWGRVLALAVARHDPDDPPEAAVAAYERTTEAMKEAVRSASRARRHFEGITCVEADVVEAIEKNVAQRKPEILLLGMSRLDRPENAEFLERVVGDHMRDVAIFRPSAETFSLAGVRRILVPVAGSSGHDPLRARVLGLLERARHREVTLLRVVGTEAERHGAERQLAELADDINASNHVVEVATDPLPSLLTHVSNSDLVIIGLSRRRGAPLFGHVVRSIAADSGTSLLMIARTTRATRKQVTG